MSKNSRMFYNVDLYTVDLSFVKGSTMLTVRGCDEKSSRLFTGMLIFSLLYEGF